MLTITIIIAKVAYNTYNVIRQYKRRVFIDFDINHSIADYAMLVSARIDAF
jgi:hypothetical protein